MRNHELMVADNDWVLSLFNGLQLERSDNPVVSITPEKKVRKIKESDVCFFRISQLGFDEDYPHRKSFENVLRTLDDPGFNFVYVLSGSSTGVTLHIGVVKNGNPPGEAKFSASDYGKMVEHAFLANFSGSSLTRLYSKENGDDDGEEETLTDFLKEDAKFKYAGVIMGVPAVNEDEDNGKGNGFHGIERLIDGMRGVRRPLRRREQSGDEGREDSVAGGINWRLVVVCEPVSPQEISEQTRKIINLYNQLHACSKITRQVNISQENSISSSKQQMNGVEQINSLLFSNRDNRTHTSKNGRHVQTQEESDSRQQQGIIQQSDTFNSENSYQQSQSFSATAEIVDKRCMELLTYMDETLLKRFKTGSNSGLFKTAVYYMAENPVAANRLKSCLVSLIQGNKTSLCPITYQKIERNDAAGEYLSSYRILNISDELNGDSKVLCSRPNCGLSTYLVPQEISLLAGLPQKEVPGIPLCECINFGLNMSPGFPRHPRNGILLGNMIQKNTIIEGHPFFIDRDSLKKHVFVAGTTGSGKTTTCLRLLSEAKVPFLVIEPAKTEYRILLDNQLRNQLQDVTVFTLGNDSVAPFRLNPFELFEGENVFGHIDMIKAAFTSAFPMEGSMPQLLDEAIYECYREKGWDDVVTDDRFTSGEVVFPTISDLLRKLEEVVKGKKFGERLQSEYIGSLVSRLSNLTVGSKGRMLDCRRSIDFEFLLRHNVILEMDDMKSPEDKALLMGFILSRLTEYVKMLHEKDSKFQHITLVEEAHRLLAKTDYSDGGAKKNAVGAFTDMLAEVRKYGECLIIADQIPNKLASDVLKNTNTKIVHKLFVKDDKDAVGDAMLMDNKQKSFLSALKTGQAIVFSEQTPKPIHVSVDRRTPSGQEFNTSSNPHGLEKKIKEVFEKKRKDFGPAYSDLAFETGYGRFERLLDEFINGDDQTKKDIHPELVKLVRSISKKDGRKPVDVSQRLFQKYNQKKDFDSKRWHIKFAGLFVQDELTDDSIVSFMQYTIHAKQKRKEN